MYADIREGSIGEGALSTISASFEHESCGRTALRIYARHMSLARCMHTVIGYVKNQHPINALNAIGLNLFRIKSAQVDVGVNKIRVE